MFWRFGGYSNISTIDTLLEKPTTTLEDLLEEQDLIQELKSHHTKLIEFIRNDDHLKQLLTYVVAPGPETGDDEDLIDPEDTPVDEEKEKAEKKRLKYAFVACEILSCETWSITEAVMANTDDLRDFWHFIKKPAPLDPLQAGYFTKVNEALLEKKTEEMLDFFKSLPDIVPSLLQHVDCPMVMDLLLKIISLEKAEGGAGIVEWLHDQDLIPNLLDNLSPTCNSSTQTSAGDFLKAIITISANAAQNEQSCIGPNSLTRQLVSDACIRQLISQMLNGGNPLTVGVGIIIEVIRKNNSDYDPDNGQNPGAPPTTHDPIYLGTLLRAFATHVPDFMNLILSSKHSITDGEKTRQVDRGTLKSAWGTDIEPLGFDRFKTCELMAELLHCSNMALLNERGSEQFVKNRDDQRQKLMATRSLSDRNQGDDSAVDASMTVIPLDSSFDHSLNASTEDPRGSIQSDEDGFEKVPPADANEGEQTGKSEESQTSSLLSPTSRLTDNVRRLSLEDVHMTEADIPTVHSTAAKVEDYSPHPEDRPAPLFSKTDSHKAPTSTSSDPPSSLLGDSSMSGIAAGQSSEIDAEAQASSEEPVVGDYLKMQFVENKVVPTILSFFFRFPWNNFLHNVVYDVVQQVFNGPMDRGHNKYLAFDLFETGKITEQIVNGQNRSEEAERTKSMRLGYMGHLTLVAEEVVKFGERHPREALAEAVQNSIYGRDWEEYVTKTLAETRERDNAILGGFRPENGLGPRQAVLNAVNAGAGFTGSNALAQVGLTGGQQGLENVDLSNNGSATSAAFSSSGGSLLSGFGSSSDDEDEDMEDDNDSQTRSAIHAIQLSAADTGASADSDLPIPLLPPPPAPLNIEPSRARRRLAERLTHRQQQQQEQEAAASEFGMEEDPFAALDDNDNDNDDPFSLDEEEQDITSFGKRVNSSSNKNGGDGSGSTASRSIHGLFSSGFGQRDLRRHGVVHDSSSSSDSDDDADHPPEEARTSLKRRPLDIDDEIEDDDDDEMGEMVAPEEGPNSSDDEEVLSPDERAKLGLSENRDEDESGSEFDGQADDDHDVVEIPKMPRTEARRRSLGPSA